MMQPWGAVEIPAGRDGINRIKNITLMRPSQLAYAESVVADRFVFEKMPGASKINTVALGGDVLGHWDFIVGATQELVAYVDTGASASIVTVGAGGVIDTLKSGLTTGGFPWFAEGWDGAQKVLLISNGLDAIQVHTSGGVATADLAKPSPDWASNKPAALANTRTRLVAWGNSNHPHSLYLTTPGTIDVDSPESALEIMYPGIGQKITAGKSFKERFYIGKYPLGIMFLDDSDPGPANWTRDIVTENIGLSGPGCWMDLGDDLLILSTDGYFYALSQIRTQGQTEVPPFMPQETSDFIKEQINLTQLHKVRSIWFGHKRQAWFAVPTGASTFCNAIIILDLNEPGNPKLLYSTRDECPSLTMRRASVTAVSKPSVGDNDGFIWQGDQSVRNKDGNGYNAQYETVPVAMVPGAVHRANLEELQIVMQPLGNWDMTIEVLRDGVPSQTIAYSMQTPGAGTGSISLDSDVIAGQTIATVRHRLEGDCRYLKLIGQNDNAGENFAVAAHIVRITGGNERQ